MPIDRVEAKFKLGQNRPRGDIQGVIAGLVEQGGSDDRALAELIRDALRAKGA